MMLALLFEVTDLQMPWPGRSLLLLHANEICLNNIGPIFKKGRKDDSGNCWPVSLTSVPGKIVEQILLEAILRHTAEREVTCNNQHGLWKRNRVSRQAKSHWYHLSGVQYCLWYNPPLCPSLLQRYGFDGWTVWWIRNCLWDCTQSGVQWLNVQWRSVMSGVPQRPVLVLTLFNIFINDTDSGINCTLSKIVIDANLCSAIDMVEGWDAIQRNLDRL